ncbi:glycosyltransferase [Akkermansiaceae bacterium]|nr:glycosyltransferase [Akkermansiaceae bacterium]MDB4403329.1 glycosyltransferase [bacterium]MDB4389016.1 glycosyltransferase [Akkermansiaceae bacterium]MDB4531340.1 glycosyltransferase [Akkermansiaceae bacterium]MDB4550671.1 glycosyltransferase [Akkermansiaceae bacterium]
MKVCVASPYPLSELKGNSVTTDRIVAMLNEGGVEARGSHGNDGEPADILITLHAIKGAPAVFDFKKKTPNGRVIVLLTGTDIYQGLAEGAEIGGDALQVADRIVVPQEAAIRKLPEKVRGKTVVIRPSLDPIAVKATPSQSPFVISVVGHLRPVKRPFLTIETLAQHPEWSDVEVWQIGQALDAEMRKTAEFWMEEDKRYRWCGGLPREESLALCAKSSLTINSSILEGGANAVLEAMTMGVPVLASRIEGNVGLLGDDYPGYFEDGEIAKALEAIMHQRVDLDEWSRLLADRLPLFSRVRESESWLELLIELK